MTCERGVLNNFGMTGEGFGAPCLEALPVRGGYVRSMGLSTKSVAERSPTMHSFYAEWARESEGQSQGEQFGGN